MLNPKRALFALVLTFAITPPPVVFAQAGTNALDSGYIEYSFTETDRTYYDGKPYNIQEVLPDGKAVVENQNVKQLGKDLTTVVGHSSKIVEIDPETGLPYSDLKTTWTVITGNGKIATLEDTDINLTFGNGRKIDDIQREICVFDGEHLYKRVIRTVGPESRRDLITSETTTRYPKWVFNPRDSYILPPLQNAAKDKDKLYVREGNNDYVVADTEMPYLLSHTVKRSGKVLTINEYLDYKPSEIGLVLPSSLSLERYSVQKNRISHKKTWQDISYQHSSEARFAELLQMATGQ